MNNGEWTHQIQAGYDADTEAFLWGRGRLIHKKLGYVILVTESYDFGIEGLRIFKPDDDPNTPLALSTDRWSWEYLWDEQAGVWWCRSLESQLG